MGKRAYYGVNKGTHTTMTAPEILFLPSGDVTDIPVAQGDWEHARAQVERSRGSARVVPEDWQDDDFVLLLGALRTLAAGDSSR